MRMHVLAALFVFPVAAAAGGSATTATAGAHAAIVPAYVTAAINDPARKADVADDARRQIAAVMTFTGVKPGDKVLELVPGSGYWTRVFSAIVGLRRSRLYGLAERDGRSFPPKRFANGRTLVATPHYQQCARC